MKKHIELNILKNLFWFIFTQIESGSVPGDQLHEKFSFNSVSGMISSDYPNL